MNRLREALCLSALLVAGCAPDLDQRCSTAADCPSRQCVAGRCLTPAPDPDAAETPPAPDPDAAETPPAPDPDAAPPAPRDAAPPPDLDAAPPLPPDLDATPALPPDPDAAPAPVPDASPPPPPDPDAAPPPPDPDAVVPPDAAPPPTPDAFIPPERCDGIDQDGDGAIDEDFPELGEGCFAGEGACAARGVRVCAPDALGTLCDAAPGQPGLEVCNRVDDDCDGQVDEGVARTFWVDADTDGYGDLNGPILACDAPVGFVDDRSDCDDANPAVHPDVKERCNGFDDDCDGNIDVGAVGALIDCGVPHGESACRAGVCSPPRCAPGWHDLDGVTENGCERGCDDAGEGLPVGGRADAPMEPMAIAGDAPGLLWSDTAIAPEGRLHFVAGPVASLVGRADAAYRKPSLARAGSGYVATAIRTLYLPENGRMPVPEGVMLGIDTAGATTFEFVVSGLDGASAVAATHAADGRDVALSVIASSSPLAGGIEIVCADLQRLGDLAPQYVALPEATAPARPVARALGGRFGIALPAGAGVVLLLLEADCRPTGQVTVPFEHVTSSAGLAYAVSPDGRPIAVVSGQDAGNVTVAALDLSNPLVPITLSVERLQNAMTFGSPASVVPTAGGFWVFACEEQAGARGFGFPLDFVGHRVGDPQFVARPPAEIGIVDYLRATDTADGVGLTWIIPASPGLRAPARQARITCD